MKRIVETSETKQIQKTNYKYNDNSFKKYYLYEH